MDDGPADLFTELGFAGADRFNWRYVECKECGDVFESSESKDMAIEERKSSDEE